MVGICLKQGWQHCGCGQCHPNPLCHLRGRWPPALVKSPILIFVSLHSLIFAAPPGSTVPITWGNQVTLPLEDESSMSVISRLLLLWTQFCIEFTAIPGSQCGRLHWGRGLCEEDWVRVGILSLGGGLLVHYKSWDQGNCSLCWVNPVLRCESITNFPNGIDISDAGDILIGDSHGNRFWLKLGFASGLLNSFTWCCANALQCSVQFMTLYSLVYIGYYTIVIFFYRFHVAVFANDGNLLAEFECPHVKVFCFQHQICHCPQIEVFQILRSFTIFSFSRCLAAVASRSPVKDM